MPEESEIDRMLREAGEAAEASEAEDARKREFVAAAIDYAVSDAAQPIVDGIKRALGEVTPISSIKEADLTVRKFKVSGRAPRSHVSVELTVTVSGRLAIVDNPREVRYDLKIEGRCAIPARPPVSFAISAYETASGRPRISADQVAQAIKTQVAKMVGLPTPLPPPEQLKP